jgi:hypothetical protein
MRARVLLPLALAAVWARPASALETGKYRFDPGGKVRAVRAFDVDGDGRKDLVLLLEPREGRISQLLILRSPPEPDAKTFFRAADAVRIPCGDDLATSGAVALGRFGPQGEFRLRFFGPTGLLDIDRTGARPTPDGRLAVPTLLVRSPDRPIALWDGVADLDGDGRDECWFPTPEDGGSIRVLGGTPAGDRRLDLAVTSAATSSQEDLIRRTAYVPNLAAADLDGDKRRELVALRDGTLVAWPASAEGAPGAGAGAGARVAPSFTLPLPFLAAQKDLGPEEIRTPRLQVADADGDGKADLLLTLVTGRRDQLGGLRTTLFYFPGPLVDASGALRPPEGRIDTESLVLHPRFVDLDGDGALDYLTDSIRGNRTDLIRNALGADPTITLVGFRFDKATRRFETQPWFSVQRGYASQQALSNQFGQSAWFEADLDGDGLNDLVDLGNLTGVEALAARRRAAGSAGDPLQFGETLIPRIPVPKGLSAGAVAADLTGDKRTDVVLWNDEELFVLAPRGAR